MSTWTDQSTFKQNSDFVARPIVDELVLIPLQRRLEDVQSIYSLNPAGREVWDLINGKRTVEEIRKAFLALYEDIDPAAAAQDFQTLFQHLMDIKAIEQI